MSTETPAVAGALRDPLTLPHNISPSRVARYYYHQCPRYLRYHATPRQRREAEGIPEPPHDHGPVTAAILEGGYAWETTVVGTRLRGRVRVNETDQRALLRDRVFPADATLAALASLNPGEYLYQGTLIAPESLYSQYGLDPAAVNLTPCRPDLLQLVEADSEPSSGRCHPSLRVLDLKASASLKTSHRVQVGFYAMILSHVVQSATSPAADLELGGVWLYGRQEPEIFDLRSVLPHINKLLREDLPGYLQAPADEVPWHLNYRCEWCEYFAHCAADARSRNSVSLIPYLTTHGRNHLRASGVSTLSDLAGLLARPDAAAVLAGSASLAGREGRLGESLLSLTSGEVRRLGSSSVAMPKGENIRLLLTVQREPVTGGVYAAALLRTGGSEVFPERSHERQFVAASHEDCGRIQRAFIEELFRLFQAVHEYNQCRPWRERRSLQAYVFDSYERDLLYEVLQAGLYDPAVADMALALLFHFHSECLVAAEEHPAEETDFPLIVLSGVVRALFALPIPVSYHLADVAACLPPGDGREPFAYSRSDFFDFELSNALKSDAIHQAWHKAAGSTLERVAVRLRMRLWAASSVVDGIRSAAVDTGTGRSYLFACPPKFALPAARRLRSPLVSRLAFIARYESALGYLDVRAGRALPPEERELNQCSFRLRALTPSRFIAEPAVAAAELEPGDRARWLLTEDTWEGEQAQLAFPDQRYPSTEWVPKGYPVAYAAIRDVESTGGGAVTLKLEIKAGQDSPSLVPGRAYRLHRTFSDFNTSRVVARLAEIDAQPSPACMALLEDPLAFGAKTMANQQVVAAARGLLAASRFSVSQGKAYEHILDHSLTLVWGPPGTGKTHFLAQAVLNMTRAAGAAGVPMRVLVTAYTHAAIENCLRKICELKVYSGAGTAPPVVKIGPLQSQAGNPEAIASVQARDARYYLQAQPVAVVGATTFAMLTAFRDMPGAAPFDLLVIDEGAQVRVPESMLAVSRLAPGGRLVIAGDDLQLPPIIKGVYPPQADGAIQQLHGSIFQALREPDRGHDILTVQLHENFRMNNSLCAFPSAALYGPAYGSVSPEVAGRRLNLGPPAQDSEPWLEAVLDPDFPWVVCILEGVLAGTENPVEARLVAAAAQALRLRLRCSDLDLLYSQDPGGDRSFWRDGLFIVSPHHAQIRAICRALAEKGLKPPYFVDTVDKMQGQECESVIVSYGLADPEQAMREGEFIYSLNRLNVAVTRARSKSIVFLPRPLLQPPLQVLEQEEPARGASYMLRLERHAAAGERLSYDVQGGRLTVLRAR